MVPEFHHILKYANIFLASNLMYLVLAEVNSSVNFFVYLARSSRFRQELRCLLRLPTIRSVRAESARRLKETTLTTAVAHSISEPSSGVHAWPCRYRWHGRFPPPRSPHDPMYQKPAEHLLSQQTEYYRNRRRHYNRFFRTPDTQTAKNKTANHSR